MQLLIPFSDIPEHGVRFDISDLSWFPEEFHEGAGPSSAEIQLVKKQEHKIEMRGTLRTGISLHCDRCLQEYKYTIVSRFDFLLELVDLDHHWCVRDLECRDGDLDIIQVREPEVDLGDVLQQQLFLSIPDKKLCDDTCKGLCRLCGANLNSKPCSCNTNETHSPFAALAALKKQIKD